MKPILTEIVDRLADLGALFDSLEAQLAAKGVLTTDEIDSRFQEHKDAGAVHLVRIRRLISALPE